MENTAVKLKCFAYIGSIDKIAVVRDGQIALDMSDLDRLRILPAGASGGGIAAVTDRHAALEPFKDRVFLLEKHREQVRRPYGE